MCDCTGVDLFEDGDLKYRIIEDTYCTGDICHHGQKQPVCCKVSSVFHMELPNLNSLGTPWYTLPQRITDTKYIVTVSLRHNPCSLTGMRHQLSVLSSPILGDTEPDSSQLAPSNRWRYRCCLSLVYLLLTKCHVSGFTVLRGATHKSPLT